MAIYKITKDVYYKNRLINCVKVIIADLSENDYNEINQTITRVNNILNNIYKYGDITVVYNIPRINNVETSVDERHIVNVNIATNAILNDMN